MKELKIKSFYGYYSSGAAFLSKEKNFFSKKNMQILDKEILNNCKRLGLNHVKLFNKKIMNVGSGREALGFVQFNPKKIYHYDISRKNILNFKKIIKFNKLSNKIISNQLDLSKDTLPKNKFDLVYLHGVIQHVDHIGKAMKNISNSLKKNGILWFYFYRPGSLNIFLGSVQKFLLKKTNVNYFFKKLNKQKYNFKFKDGIMDDCFVPNRQLFYPKDYMKHLKKLNFINFGNSLLINTNQKYNFYKFHSSVILFLKKVSNKKILTNFKNFLKPSDNIDVLDYKIYKKNEQIKEIIKILYQNKFNVFEDIFKKVVMIEKLKNNITKTYFEKKILNKTYVTTILDRLKKILKK
jgi:SAM-dependent methyltransferase